VTQPPDVQPPPPPPAPQPPPRRRNTKIIIFVVAGALAVCCLIGTVAGVFGFRAFRAVLEPPRIATEAFVQDLVRGDAAAAYQKLCESTRARTSEAELASAIGTRRPTRYEITGVDIETVNGQTTAVVRVNLTYPDGFTDPHPFRLTKEGDAWKVCGNPY
jgi:hypothetical protein